jgi:spore germination protein KB
MKKEILTRPQTIFLIVLFLFGNGVLKGIGGNVEQDAWFAIILSLIIIIPIIIIYTRIINLYPGKDLFDIIEIVFGKIFGKIITILFIWYFIHVGASVLRNFSEFIEITTMPETPQLPIMILLILIIAYIAKSGIEVLGKWSLITLSIIVFFLFFTFILSLGKADISNLFPILNHSAGAFASEAFTIFTFPFAECIILLGVGNSFKKEDKPTKTFIYAILISVALYIIAEIRNLLIIGSSMIRSSYFPTYSTVRVINIGDFLTRVEGLITINFTLAGITKIALCAIAASRGIKKLLNLTNYRIAVFPVSLLILALAPIIYENAVHMIDFLNVYRFYAIPFHIILPIIIWIIAEVKVKHQKKLRGNTS